MLIHVVGKVASRGRQRDSAETSDAFGQMSNDSSADNMNKYEKEDNGNDWDENGAAASDQSPKDEPPKTDGGNGGSNSGSGNGTSGGDQIDSAYGSNSMSQYNRSTTGSSSKGRGSGGSNLSKSSGSGCSSQIDEKPEKAETKAAKGNRDYGRFYYSHEEGLQITSSHSSGQDEQKDEDAKDDEPNKSKVGVRDPEPSKGSTPAAPTASTAAGVDGIDASQQAPSGPEGSSTSAAPATGPSIKTGRSEDKMMKVAAISQALESIDRFRLRRRHSPTTATAQRRDLATQLNDLASNLQEASTFPFVNYAEQGRQSISELVRRESTAKADFAAAVSLTDGQYSY